MKRFLLWVVGVILGVAVLLGAVMTVSYSFTGEGSCPAADTQFGGQALEVNGSCWQVPLLGGVFDKVFTSPETLTVQKLGVLYDAHPTLALPDWASYTTLTIETDIGSIVFAGSASQYEDFLFPANGDYKAKLTVWRLPQDYLATQFEGGSTGAIRKNLGVEHPAKPTGWYSYSFRFTLQASAEVALSTERLEQGGVAGPFLTRLTGQAPPWEHGRVSRHPYLLLRGAETHHKKIGLCCVDLRHDRRVVFKISVVCAADIYPGILLPYLLGGKLGNAGLCAQKKR